jgi:hypothetical protein
VIAAFAMRLDRTAPLGSVNGVVNESDNGLPSSAQERLSMN